MALNPHPVTAPQVGALPSRPPSPHSEALYRVAFEVAAVGIAHVALDGRFVEVNPRLCEILGRSAAELAGLRMQQLTHPDDRPLDENVLALLRRGGQARHRLDKRFLRPDGSAVWTAVTFGVMRDAAGQPLQCVATVEDISERKRVEAALRDSEERLRKLTDNVDGAFYLLRLVRDGRSLMTYASRGISRILELPQDATLEDVFGRIHPDDLPHVLLQLEQTRRTLEPIRLSFRVALSDGTHWLETQAIAERDASGDVVVHGFTFDVTYRKQYEQALVTADAAQRANAAKTEFLSRMSHELRTPLNAVLGFAQLLQLDSTLDEAQRTRVGHIERAGAHLLAMINDVLDLSRIEAGTMPMSPEPLAVGPLLEEAIALVIAQAQAAQVTLRPPLADPDALVRADRVRLRQVLVNLLTNAIKYNRRGGWVEVRARRGDGEVRIAVVDSGIGLSAEQIARLWEPFNRLGAERTAIEGTGIGLALSQRMVHMMNGRLDVQSEPGRGSSFTVHLPSAEGAAVPEAAGLQQAPPPYAGPRRYKVLYAEDNPLNVELVRQVFQLRPKLQLRIAHNGREALRLAHEEPPDLLLLDMHLGDLGGLEVRERLAADGIEPICVALSADVQPANVERALAAGFADYLAKPLDVAALMRCLDRLLGAPSQFGELR